MVNLPFADCQNKDFSAQLCAVLMLGESQAARTITHVTSIFLPHGLGQLVPAQLQSVPHF